MVAKAVLQKGPNAVIRAIANAALHARKGPVVVPSHLRTAFRLHNHQIDSRIDRKRPTALKLRLMLQTGDAYPKIAPLLETDFG